MHFIYLLSRRDGAIKIGCSRTPKLRAQRLSAHFCESIDLIFSKSVDRDAFRIENGAHRALADKRLDGEWFSVSAEEAKAAIAASIQRHNG